MDSSGLITRIAGASAGRRSVLRAAAVGGALAVAATLPAVVLAADDNPGKAKGQHKNGRVDVSGTTSGGASFTGQLRLVSFQAVAGTPNKLVANGVLTGTFKDAAGKTIGTLDEAPFATQVSDINPTAGTVKTAAVTAQAIPPPAGCTILHLVLAPLQLNLLGLVLTIPDTVTIDLTAVPGGGLLGDLLCAVDNLLQGGLGTLLNDLLGLGNLATALNNLVNALNAL
jgi:hypothetical protein